MTSRPGNGVDAQGTIRSPGGSCFILPGEPLGQVAVVVGHPSAEASSVFGTFAQFNRLKIIKVHVHTRQIGRHELSFSLLGVEELLQQRPAVV